jgi:RNA-directed DNA polymerase
VVSEAKPFCISKHQVMRAYQKVKANKGSAGVDGQSILDFERDLKNNLYKIWNRMSSGTYFPPSVKTVLIPKKDGGERKLGIPTVADRVAQMVVKMELEPFVEPIFHPDSYGYRPGKSAHDAVATAQSRCWKNSWVIDLDIKGFFDNLDHKMMMKAVRHHTKCQWMLLYIERWIKVGAISVDGLVESRSQGTPQGGVISPLLANLFLHYAFDAWVQRNYPDVSFERYADDIIVHCKTLTQAHRMKDAIARRLSQCKLELHPVKTKIVFCKNFKLRKQDGYPEKFDFLGFTFRQRSAKGPTGNIFDGFLAGISQSSRKKIGDRIRHWRIGNSSDLSLQDMSEMYNPTLRGCVNYYGKFYPQALKSIYYQWNYVLLKWARRKYKRFRGYHGAAGDWIYQTSRRDPKLFAIWEHFGPEDRVV